MGEIIEIQVAKGFTKQLSDKNWQRVEYTLKAKLGTSEELQVAKAQLENVVNTWLQQSFQSPQAKQPLVSKPEPDLEHAEVYEKLNWESGSGSRGAYQMIRKDNVNDTQLFNHLENMLKQNKGNLSVGNWHYWLGDRGFIFIRRVKSQKVKHVPFT